MRFKEILVRFFHFWEKKKKSSVELKWGGGVFPRGSNISSRQHKKMLVFCTTQCLPTSMLDYLDKSENLFVTGSPSITAVALVNIF